MRKVSAHVRAGGAGRVNPVVAVHVPAVERGGERGQRQLGVGVNADLGRVVLPRLRGVDVDVNQALGNRQGPLGSDQVRKNRADGEHGVAAFHQTRDRTVGGDVG